MKALKRLKNFAEKKSPKKDSRKASIVLSATLILHAQLFFPPITKAQTAPIAPTTETTPASEHTSPLPPPQASGASNVLTPEITSLLVPSANQTIFDVGNTQGVLHFTDLINTDSLHIVSTNAQYSTATIFATGNIINAGTITTLIPTGFTGAVSNLNLVLNAGGSIINSGTISSAGSLNLTAGNAIVNVVAPQLPQSIPLMQAQTDIVMQATSIINQGTINSAIGNVNLCSATSNLAINNIAGTISAPNGFINVFTSDMLHSATLDILGGDFVSRALKLKSGLVAVDVNSISGPVNLTAIEAALVARTGTLEFGTANVSGDPFIESGGDFIFKDGVTTADRLILNATGSILTDGTATAISTNHELVLNAGGVINLAGVTSLFSEGGDIKLTANGSIFVPGVSITSNGGNVFIHSENSNVSMPGAQIKSSGGDVGIVAKENVVLADSKVPTVIDTSGTLAGRVFIASKQGSVLLDHPEGPASSITAGPDQQPVVLGRYGVAIGALNEIRVGNILAPNADVAVVSGVNTVLLAADTFGIDINGTRGLGTGGITIGSIDTTNAPEGSAFEGFSGSFVWSTNGSLRNNQGTAIKTPGTLAISARNDIELAGITDVSAERRVHIASFNGSINLPDAAVSSKFLVSNLPPLQSTSVLPGSAQSVQILAHGAVTTGDIKSPAGGVHVRSAADLTGTANDNLKVFHGTNNIGNVSLGTVDISSSEFTGSGNIFIDAGENHISTGSIIGNGSTVFLGGAQTISITATDEDHPALSNNAAGPQGNLPFFKANTSIQAPGSITITGTNNPLGDIRHDGGSLTIASLFDTLTFNNVAFINTNDTFNNAFTVILQGESGVSFNGGQPLTINAHPNTENVAFVNDFTIRSFSGDLNFSGPLTVNGSAQSNNAQGATVALLSGSLSTNGKISINADGHGTGSGGVINLVTGSAPTFGLGNLQLQARGGSNGSGGQIAVESATGLTIDARSLDVTAGTDGNGGLIRLDGANMFVPGTQLIVTGGTLKADGNGTGNGGTVQLINGQSAFVLGGKGANATGIHVRSGLEGGNGGTVLAQSGGDLTINTANVNTEARGENGTGGNIRLRAGISGGDFGFVREHNGALTINGAINVSGKGVGDGGTIHAEAYSIGAEDGGGGGGGGGGVGTAAITLSATAAQGSIQVNNALTANAGAIGNGGSIRLEARASRSASGKIPELPASVLVGTPEAVANLRAEGGTSAGSGGTININSNGSVVLNSNVVSTNARGDGNGGTIEVNVDAPPVPDDGSGGGIGVSSIVMMAAFATEGEETALLNAGFRANGAGTGSGGSVIMRALQGGVSVNSPSTVALNADSGNEAGTGGELRVEAKNILLAGALAARGASDGGKIILSSTNETTVTGNFLSVNSFGPSGGNGGSIEITATNNLSIDADLMASSSGTGKGGSISVKSQEGIVQIGSELGAQQVVARGGVQSGDGGTISLSGKSVIVNSSIDVISRGELGSGGSVELASQEDLTLKNGVRAESRADAGNGGNIKFVVAGNTNVSGDVNFSAYGEGDAGELETDPDEGIFRFLNGDIYGIASRQGRGGRWTGGKTPPKILEANNVHLWGAQGGEIDIGRNSTLGIDTDTIKIGDINVSGALLDAGSVKLFSNGEVKVGAIKATASFGKGGVIYIQSGTNISTKDINVSSKLNAGGSVSLHSNLFSSNDSAAFVIGASASTNGVNGTINLSGKVSGQVVSSNSNFLYLSDDGAGGITVEDPALLQTRVTEGASTILFLTAKSDINLPHGLHGDARNAIASQIFLSSGNRIIVGENASISSDSNSGEASFVGLAANRLEYSGDLLISSSAHNGGGTVHLGSSSSIKGPGPLEVGVFPSIIESDPLNSQNFLFIDGANGKLTLAATGSRGGKIEFGAAANVSLSTGDILLDSSSTRTENGGGSIKIGANNLNFNSRMIVNVSGDNDGKHGAAGEVQVKTSGNLSIGTDASQITILANGGRGQLQGSGIVTLETQGNLFVDSTSNGFATQAYAGRKGAQIGFTGSSITILGNLDADGVGSGVAGSIVMSAKTFTMPSSLLSAKDGSTAQSAFHGPTDGLISITNKNPGNGNPNPLFLSGQLQASQQIFLRSEGPNGSISQVSAGQTVLRAPAIDIGTSLVQGGSKVGSADIPLEIDTNLLTVTAGGAVNIRNKNSDVLVLDVAKSVSDVNITTRGNLVIGYVSAGEFTQGSPASSGGNVVLRSNIGSVNTQEAATIRANGNINLNAVSGLIDIGNGTRIIGYSASSQIFLYVGKSFTAGLTPGQTPPENLVVGSGVVNFGPVNRILAQPPDNTLNVHGGAITVNPGTGSGTINFRGNVIVQSGSDLVPQSLTEQPVVREFSKLEMTNWNAFGNSQTFLAEEVDGVLTLEAGPLFIEAKRSCKIDICNVKVEVSKGTLLRIERVGENLSITNLADEKFGACRVLFGSTELKLPMGHMLYTNGKHFSEIAKRRVSKLSKSLFLAEISLSSHFLNDKLTRHVLLSTKEKSLKAKLLKAAASLGVITASHGAFQTDPLRPQI